jgi:hypothetical protein
VRTRHHDQCVVRLELSEVGCSLPDISCRLDVRKAAMSLSQADVCSEFQRDALVMLNGFYYKRMDRPCALWKLMPAEERKVRMREYMKQYRRRKRAERKRNE